MRLICPNCGAQYEVPDEVIPQGGRDVQCSNCGNTWFQRHPDDDPELADDLGEPVPDSDWSPQDDLDIADEAEAEPEPEPDPVQHRPEPPRPAPDVYDDEDADQDDIAPPPPQPVRARQLDPSVAEVLREEAEREARVRASESDSFESQPELGLGEPDEDEAARRSREARERMARMRGEAPVSEKAAAAAAAAAAGSRRELLPDIDEINSTLRSSAERRQVETPEGLPPETDAAQSGFGRGFLSVVIVAALAAALYVMAPKIIEAVPAAEGPLGNYVTMVDGGRMWLNDTVAKGLAWLTELSTPSDIPTIGGEAAES